MSIDLDRLSMGEPVFGVDQVRRSAALYPKIQYLTEFHSRNCPEYGSFLNSMFPSWRKARSLEDLPFLPVGIFKERELRSVSEESIFKVISSSGTSQQVPSRVLIDRETASRQSAALRMIMREILPGPRRSMLIIDSEESIKNRSLRSARAAGIVGLMPLGRKHSFLLDSEMQPEASSLQRFAQENETQPKLIFGFTFMVWQYLIEELKDVKVDLSGSILVHSGGWKKLESLSVGNEEFKRRLREQFGIEKVVNFYGMAEQVGTIFVEGDDGLLHSSCMGDVVIRHPESLQPLPQGEVGIIQVLSVVPTSYPGHSLLTEDLGVIESIDRESVFGGKAFRVLGRVPKVELRGCSDTHAYGSNGR